MHRLIHVLVDGEKYQFAAPGAKLTDGPFEYEETMRSDQHGSYDVAFTVDRPG